MKKLALHWKIIIGMVLGIIWALLSSSMGWSEFTINWIDPFGTIFIRLLKFNIIKYKTKFYLHFINYTMHLP
mgnify:CR=1 FL=1